ncbi:MAG: DUF3368 domain-containing protein [Candidatus Helarchaeales archaeon]
MPLAVSDSDVLIHLSKLNRLELLLHQFSRIFISDVIFRETIIQGMALKKYDAFILKDFLKKQLIKVEKAEKKETSAIMRKYNIHEGESSIIVLAKKFNVSYCLANECKVRKILKSEGFQVVGTLGIILKSYKLGKLNKNETLNLLQKIQINAEIFRFRPKLIKKLISTLFP